MPPAPTPEHRLAALRRSLGSAPPDARAWPRLRRHAAIAVILRPSGDDLEVLLMRRQRRAGDRWSGDVACPGGFAHPGEAPIDAAIRETREELGITLDPSQLLGALSLRPASPWHRMADFQLAPFVFSLPAGPRPLTLEASEVASARWVPLRVLGDPSARSWFWWWWRFARPLALPVRIAIPVRVPRVWHEDYDVWGLTLRILDELNARLDAAT